MERNDLNKLRDKQIPTTRAPNPVLDARAEKRRAKAEAGFLPGAPLPVVKTAQEAATATGVTLLLLIGLWVKLTRTPTVRLNPSRLRQVGLSEGQARRAVSGLVEAGLISVSSAPGKRREITLIDETYLAWLRVPKKHPDDLGSAPG